jgi:dTDP-D-glucose 4,6-dehydratase
MNIDLTKLSYVEIKQLEKDIEQQKASRKYMRCYKVTFMIGFLANKHEDDGLNDPEDFGDYFVNGPSNLICKYFGLKSPEEVSGCEVMELKPEEFPEMFKAE